MVARYTGSMHGPQPHPKNVPYHGDYSHLRELPASLHFPSILVAVRSRTILIITAEPCKTTGYIQHNFDFFLYITRDVEHFGEL